MPRAVLGPMSTFSLRKRGSIRRLGVASEIKPKSNYLKWNRTQTNLSKTNQQKHNTRNVLAQQPKGRDGLKNNLIWGLQWCLQGCLGFGAYGSTKMVSAPAFPSQLHIHWGGGPASLCPPFLPKPHPLAPLMGHLTSLTQNPPQENLVCSRTRGLRRAHGRIARDHYEEDEVCRHWAAKPTCDTSEAFATLLRWEDGCWARPGDSLKGTHLSELLFEGMHDWDMARLEGGSSEVETRAIGLWSPSFSSVLYTTTTRTAGWITSPLAPLSPHLALSFDNSTLRKPVTRWTIMTESSNDVTIAKYLVLFLSSINFKWA